MGQCNSFHAAGCAAGDSGGGFAVRAGTVTAISVRMILLSLLLVVLLLVLCWFSAAADSGCAVGFSC